MTQHKWHKEIKAWADGAEIEVKDGKSSWWVTPSPEWVINDSTEYRIKPQPKEPQYLYVYINMQIDKHNYVFRTSKHADGAYIGKIKLEDDDVGAT
jgi:hypothetical protein